MPQKEQRERLIELQKEFHEHIAETCPRHHEISCDGCQYDLGDSCDWKAKLADHLLSNGVVAVDVDAVSAPNRPLISQCLGHPLDEIIDLIRAKEEGRIIVPPCKIGTHLWRVTHPYRQEPKVTEFVVKNFRTVGKKHQLQIEVQAVNVPVTNWMRFEAFCTTKEEAEADLAERKQNEM